VKKPESASFYDQEILDNQRIRRAVRRYYATAADPTKIVDGLPRARDTAVAVTRLDDAA
jgi:hypothetical protein